MNLHDVIRGPIITEKATALQEGDTVCFRVASDANKLLVKRAVEKLFGVKVARVRTARMNGKMKRYGRFEGKRPDWKKAYVTLREGEKMIEFFEGV